MANETTPESQRIVVGVDGSPASILALQWAQTMGTALGATVSAVTVWHLDVAYTPYTLTDWDPEGLAEETLQTALTQAYGDQRPQGLSARIVRGRPAEVLIKEGESARMLVVGSRGHGGFAGLLLGSVSAACAEHASCPVLIIHGAGESPAPGTGGDD
ncbi:MAG: universal stress protein [Acidobacteria bacterium]|nr:universal stress protein [Acidobacteriota bacterium]